MLRMQNFRKRMNTCIVEVLIEWTAVTICILLRKYSEPESKNSCVCYARLAFSPTDSHGKYVRLSTTEHYGWNVHDYCIFVVLLSL